MDLFIQKKEPTYQKGGGGTRAPTKQQQKTRKQPSPSGENRGTWYEQRPATEERSQVVLSDSPILLAVRLNKSGLSIHIFSFFPFIEVHLSSFLIWMFVFIEGVALEMFIIIFILAMQDHSK